MLFDKIKKIAKTKGCSIYKIEKDAGLSPGSICKWNENEPSVNKVQKVAEYLGVPIEKLLE